MVVTSRGGAYINATAYETLEPCENLSSAVCMQCAGDYKDSDIIPRSEFSLQLRGDDPSSPRLYSAAQYCSLPIIISDQQYTHAMPFQCLVCTRICPPTCRMGAVPADVPVARGVRPWVWP